MCQGNINIDEVRSISQEIWTRGNLSDDGILDFKKYEVAKPRILWLLKQEVGDYGLEDRSRGELVGRDWHEYYPRAIINDANNDNLRTSRTWGKMAIASHMLIKDVDYEHASAVSSEELCESLLSTAVVEVHKEPGKSTTPPSLLLAGFEKYKAIVDRQLQAYAPDIVIACFPESAREIVLHCQVVMGGTHDAAAWDWCEGGYGGRCAELRDRLLFWTYHPSARTNKARYCNEIAQAWRCMKGGSVKDVTAECQV